MASDKKTKVSARAGLEAKWWSNLPDYGAEKLLIRRNFSFQLVAFFVAAASIFGLPGCGSGNGSTNVSAITITPSSVTVPINTQTQFTAVVKLVNSTTSSTTTVTWEVNGTAGGSSTIGTIVPSSVDAEVGVYTAPGAVPTTGSTQVGQVNITAVVEGTTSSTSTTATVPTVTSNTAVVTVGVGAGFTVTPSTAVVPAGANSQFTALLNSVGDPAATWTVTSANGGDAGTIDSSGLYTAPLSPPPGNSITITATDGSNTATAAATVAYSDHSLDGPYAFSYTGNDSAGFLGVAGSFVADGSGHIVSGIEDFDSFLTGVSKQVTLTGTYLVGVDGRGSATLTTGTGTVTLQFALSTNKQGELVRFDSNATGGGTIEQENLNDLSNSLSTLSGPYVFIATGVDSPSTPHPIGIGGKFSADGAGNIPATNTIVDVNDNGIGNAAGITTSDRTLQGSYQFDASFPGTGRGTLTLTSTTTGSREYAFYIVDAAHLRLVEIDGNEFMAGRMVAAPAGNSFSVASLVSANYLFTSGGNSAAGAYADDGVFASDGNGTIPSGTFDANNAGTYNNGPALGSCPYTVDAATGRTDLKLFAGSGNCPATPSSSISEFAVYPTVEGTALMLEIDTNALSTGSAYQQCFVASACSSGTPSLTAGSLALGLTGQGIFHNNSAAYQQNVDGQLTTSTSISSGTLDINNFNAVFPADPVTTTGSSIGSPSTSGRGTAVIVTTNPAATYNLIYYLIDDNSALLFDQDTTRVLRGALVRQF
jgi:hypothetical protein